MSKTLYLIDGHAQIYRAFYALEGLTSPDGRPTGAIFQFTRMLIHLLREQKPDYLAVVFDAPGKNFRHDLYPEYKANRKPAPPELTAQIGPIQQIVRGYNIPVYMQAGFEADDLLGSLARRAEADGNEVVIVSGDKDLGQILSDRVCLYDPKKNLFTTAENFTAENGFGPEKLPDLMGLWGDAADNIPGVEGIGQKTGRELIAKYGCLEDLLDRASEIKGKRGETLLKSREVAMLSKRLAIIDTQVPVELDYPALAPRHPDLPALHAIFSDYGLRNLLKELEHDYGVPGGAPAGVPTAASGGADEAGEQIPLNATVHPRDYRIIDTPELFDAFLKALKDEDHFVIDTETTSEDPMRADLVGISISWSPHQAFYLPFRAPAGERVLDRRELEWLRPILENPQIGKCGQNAKYDRIVLRRAGIELRGLDFDTLIASSLFSAHLRGHDLDTLAGRYLGMVKIPTKSILGTGQKQITMDQAPVAQVGEYACEDADATFQLETVFRERLGADEQRLMTELELPLCEVLEEMQVTGIRVDCDILARQSVELGRLLEVLTARIHELAGHEFNLASPLQLQKVLFEEMGLPVIRKTKTGASTDESVLSELAAEGYELPKQMLEHRQYAKLKNTYIDALPGLVNPQTGRIHTTFSQTTTATGRLSSSNPNLQNIPVRSEFGKAIRAAFIPQDGWVLLAADYSQVELRMLAHFSGDAALVRAFKEGRDIHRVAAANVNGILEDEVTAGQRQAAKAVNFGIIYGQTAHGLSQTTGMSRPQAQMFIDSYFEQFPDVKRFIDDTIFRAHDEGGVRTLLGRWREIPELKAGKRQLIERAEREAVNTLIQGSAADLIKKAMIALRAKMRTVTPQARLLLQIHDELVLECPPEELPALQALVRQEMENALTLSVPLVVDMGSGQNWLEVK